jgi:peptidyl-prolyl cis-trans isomerase D
VKFTFGWVILHVTKIVPGVNQSFDAVKAALRKETMGQLASAKLTDVSNAFDDASAGGASLADAATRAGMHYIRIAAVDKDGLAPGGARTVLPTAPDFRAQVQKSDVGEEGDPFPASDGHVYVVRVNGITPPKLKSLATVRADATAAWTAEQQRKRIAEKALALSAQAGADKTLSKIAAQLHATVQSSGAISRNAPNAALPAQLVQDIFKAPPGGIVSAPAPQGGGYIIARVTGISYPPDQSKNPYFKSFIDNLSQQLSWGSDLVEAFASTARDQAGVKINQKQVNQITGGS